MAMPSRPVSPSSRSTITSKYSQRVALLQGNGGYVNDFQTSASVGAERLKANGIPGESLQMVPSHVIDRDRTYGAAVALRDWFSAHKIQVRYVNVITEDLHARRTRLLFKRHSEMVSKIGIIAVPES